MDHKKNLQRRTVQNAGALIKLLAGLLGIKPAELAAELLDAYTCTDLYRLLWCEFELVDDDQNKLSVAELALLMQVTDVDLVRHVAERREKTFVLHTVFDGVEQETETFAFAKDSEDPELRVYKDQYTHEFKGFDADVLYKPYGRVKLP
jgi:hypothetical protein